jgi:hypothetical protein
MVPRPRTFTSRPSTRFRLPKKYEPGREVDGLAALGIEALVVNAGCRRESWDRAAAAAAARRQRERAFGVVEKVAGPRDGELGRPGEPEADGLALAARGPQSQPPGLNVDAAIPEARLGGGDLHVTGPVMSKLTNS